MENKKRDNYFSGITIDYKIINEYYPVSYKNPYFDHFVFQTMVEDGACADINFTIAAYAADADGTVLNGEHMLQTYPLPHHKVPATKPRIQFANMHLDLTALGQLYPPGVTTELKVYPKKYYCGQNGNETPYMAYIAETGTEDEYALAKAPLNPSPPFHG